MMIKGYANGHASIYNIPNENLGCSKAPEYSSLSRLLVRAVSCTIRAFCGGVTCLF